MNEAEKADLDCLFLCGSSTAKMCTVPWSLATQINDESLLKLILQHIQKWLQY